MRSDGVGKMFRYVGAAFAFLGIYDWTYIRGYILRVLPWSFDIWLDNFIAGGAYFVRLLLLPVVLMVVAIVALRETKLLPRANFVPLILVCVLLGLANAVLLAVLPIFLMP